MPIKIRRDAITGKLLRRDVARERMTTRIAKIGRKAATTRMASSSGFTAADLEPAHGGSPPSWRKPRRPATPL